MFSTSVLKEHTIYLDDGRRKAYSRVKSFLYFLELLTKGWLKPKATGVQCRESQEAGVIREIHRRGRIEQKSKGQGAVRIMKQCGKCGAVSVGKSSTTGSPTMPPKCWPISPV